MTPLRRTALVAGLLYLLTFVSIPTLALYGRVHGPNYVLGPGPDTAVLVGGVLEVIVALAGIGTAVALYPVLKRQNEGMAWALSARESWKPPASSLADLPSLAKPHARCKRPLAGLPVVPVALGAAGSPRARTHRSTPASRFRSCRAVRRGGTSVRAARDRRTSGRAI